MGAFAILLSRSTSSFTVAAFNMTLVGFFGGLFAVPLNALLQQRSGEREKGRLMATNNFLNTVGVMLASAALWFCTDLLGMRADQSFDDHQHAELLCRVRAQVQRRRVRGLASCRGRSREAANP